MNRSQKLEMELKNDLISEALRIGYFIYTIDTTEMVWNDQVYPLLQLSVDTKQNKFDHWFRRIHAEEISFVREEYQRIIREKDSFDIRYKLKSKEGFYIDVRSKAKVLLDDKGTPEKIVGIIWDISDEIKAFENAEIEKMKMINISKMATLGEMSSSIIHEINNPMAVILSNSEIIERYAEGKITDLNILKKSSASIKRMNERIIRIIRSIQAHTRDGSNDSFSPSSLCSIFQNVHDLTKPKFTCLSTEITFSVPEEQLKISCRSVQIEQVLINLINNSIDAMEGQENKWIKVEHQPHKDHVVISVTDSGPGIPPDLQSKIMKPFFTTKERGKGTGLGLSISATIINEHKGEFNIDKSHPHTRFLIKLPVVNN